MSQAASYITFEPQPLYLSGDTLKDIGMLTASKWLEDGSPSGQDEAPCGFADLPQGVSMP